MKKTIQRRISRIAASAVAVAVAVTGIANSKFGNPSVSYAATIMDYDAVSSVNYADVLGRGIDYGVVSDQFVQSMHMETTFATNLFTNAGGEQNCDVDLAGDAPAHFIIAEVEDGSQVRFGRTYEGADSVLFNIETTESIKNNNIAYDNVCKADPQYKIDTYDNLKGKVDSIIGHIQDESKRFLSKPAVNIDDIADYKNGKAVIDLTDSRYDNAVVYINIPEDSAIGNNLKGAEVLNIVKNSNTVIVFNVLTPNKVTLPQYTMTIADYDKAGYDFEVDGELKDGKLTFNSTTTHSGEDSIHNRIVDKEMCQKVIWNIPNSKEVAFDTTAGTFLLPNPETYAYTVGSSAGWVASAGKTEVRGGEWHYIYHGRSEDGFDKNKSSFHFASYKTFTNKFNGKNTEQIDNIYAGEGEFTFSFTETESDYKTTVKNYENVSTDKNGRIIFPSLSFAAKEIDPRNPEMHYYVIKEVSMKDKDSKITLSKGEIDIALKVVNNNGVLSYYVSSVKYLTNKHDSNDIAAVNEDVNMSGIEFGLGGFYNLYDLKTSEIDITKKISTDDLNSFNNKYKNEKYKVAIKKGDLYVQNNEGGLALSEHYFEVMSGETVHVSGLVPGDYKVIEAGENLVDYKLDNIEYKINGQSKDSFTVNNDGSKVNAEVVNTYKKLDTDNKALLEVYKETKGLPTSYSNKEFEVAVVANVENGPVKYVQNANGDLGDQPVYFKIKALETISFAVPKIAKNYQNNDAKCTYQVIEKKAEIDGYKWSTTYSNRGEEVITDAVDVKDIDNATKVSLLNTYSRETGNLTINKSFKVNGSDMTNDKAFANAKFIISGPEDFEKVEVSYADFKGGSYTLNNIPLGQYTVTETNMKNSAPDGYGYVTTRYNTGNSCTLNNNNKNGEIGITNEYRKLSSLAIRKTVVTESGSKVTKDRFKLAVKNNSGKYYDPKSGEFTSAEIVYFTVNVDEDYVIKNIPEGSYTITEDLTDAAVDGYKLTTNGIGTGVYVSGNATANVTNTYSRDDSAKTYTLNLKKKAIDAPYSDTVYEIAVKKGDQYLVANGDLVSEPYFFKLTNDEEIKLTLRDAGPYTIVEKTENVSENDNFTLETLYEVDGKVVANGAFSFSNSKTKVDAVVRNNYEHIGGPETGEFEIVKVNSKDNGINLEGATYGLYLSVSESDEDLTYPKVIVDGESCYQVDIKTTNYDGVVKFENVFADKNYIVKELETVDGYYLSEDAIKVSVAVKNGKSTVSIENNGNGIAKLSNGQVLWLENEIIIEISKINRGGDLLAGAILHIEDEDENIIVDSIKTNDNGVITISGKDYSSLVAGRKYYLVEDKAPNGYVIADPVEFEIGVTPKVSTSGKINPVKVNMIDDEVVKTAKLELNKTIDGENITEDDLKNLKFTVQDDGGKYLYKDSEGNVKISKTKVEISLGEFDKDMYGMYSYVFEDVEFGEYTITETQANIEGYDIKYVKMNGQEVKEGTDKSYSTNIVLTRAGKTLWIEDAYKVQTGDLELTKTIDGKNVTEDDLENLKFTVQNEKGEYLYKEDGKVKTSKDKVEIALGEFDKNNDGTYSLKFEDIEVGKYTVKETQANIEGYDIEYVQMDGKKVNASEDNSFTSTAVVTKDGKVIEIVDAYKAQTGDLEIKKTIDGENITEDDLENLKFIVQNEAGEYLYKEDGKVKTSKDKHEIALGEFDKNNDGTYSLKFEDIEVGKYTVKETQANIEGYDIEYVEMDGKKVNASEDNSFTSTAVVTKDGKVIEIVDAYKAQTGDLEIKKTIDGENITEDDLENLKFTVQNEKGEYLSKDKEGKVVTSKEKVEIALGEFDKNNDGTYSLKFEDIEVGKYTVKETQANIEGYELEYVKMNGSEVSEGNDKAYTTNTVVTKDGKVIEIVDAYKVQTGDLEIKKTIDGENITEDDLENLKFTVQNEAGEYLYKEDGKVKTGKDKVEIALGQFDKNNDGTYSLKFEDIEVGKYTVKETQANIEGYELEYVKMNGQVVSEGTDKAYTSNTVVTKDGKTVTIEDKYNKIVETGDLTLTKTIDGKNVTEDDLENLKFTVQNEAGEYLYKDENGKVQTSKEKVEIKLGDFDKNNDGTYSYKFEDIEVGKYTVKETQANIEGYDIEYVQMDGKKVNASEDNSFTSTAVVTKDGKVIEIVDAYKAQTGDLELTKTIDGKNVTKDDLENLKFTVQNEVGEYLYKEDGKVKTSKDKVEIALGEFDKNNDGTYSLKFEDIEVGKYTVKETQANIEGYDIEYVQMDGKKVNASEDNSFTSTAVVTKDGKVIEIVDAYKVQTGDLEIKKTIDGENITEDDLENLKFTVQNEAGEYLYKEDGKVKTSKDKHEIALGEFDKNNDGTYSLKFEDIEVGKYTVKETQANIEGYDIEYVEMDGKKVNASEDKSFTSTTVVTKDGKVIEIVDAYKAQTGDLEIKKTIDGDNITEDDLENLKFTVQNEAGEYLYKEDGKVKTSKDKHEIALGEFDKNNDGTYSLKFEDIEVGKYTVKETQANIEGYDIEYVEMDGKKVNASEDKSFTSTAVVTKDGKVIEIVDAYKAQTGDLELTKTIDGKNVTEDDLENLKFTVQNENGEYLSKDKEGKVVTSKEKVEIALGEFDKNNDGTYSLKFEDIEVGKYTVKETQANIEGYDIEYVQMDGKKVNASEDNSFTSTAVVTKDGKVIEIVDAYKVQTGDLEIKKTIDGENITEDDLENLKFTVQNEAGEFLSKDKEGKVVTSKDKVEIALGEFDKNNDGTYSLKFEDIEVGKYTVKETQANIEGYDIEYVEMDGKKVNASEDKSFTSTTVVTKDGKVIEIVDAYKAQTGDLELTKTIDGKNVTEDDLENLKFIVQNEKGEYLSKDKDGKVVTSKEKVEIALGEFDKNNDGTYSLKFEDIEVGKYTVKETQANIEGYELEYVKMNGSEVSEGTDKAYTTNTVVTKDGKTVTIEDKYKEIIETGDLTIKKTIDGENITEDDLKNLKFTVQNEDGKYLYKEDGKVKTSKDKVEIALGEFDKNNDGTYILTFEDIEVGKYTVKETQANIEGYDIEYVKMNGSEVSEGTDKAYTSNTVLTKDGKTVTIEDAYKVQTGDLEIRKTIDGENITEDDLENLKFTVQNEAGEYLYKEDGKVKTSKDKVEIKLGDFDKNTDGTYSYKFEDIEVGKYTVKETQANIEGYELEYVKMNGSEVSEGTDKAYTSNTVLTKDGKTVTIEDAYKVQTGDLEIRKTIDGENITEDDLENLKFTVQNEAGEYLYKEDGKVKTSKDKVEIKLGDFDKNTDGTYSYKFEDIEVGKYTVKETQANIEGYDIEYVEMDGKKVNASEDNSFTSTAVVTKDGKVIEIVDAYQVQTGDLEIKKTIDGENITEDDLENLKFTVQNEAGEYLYKEDGKVKTSKDKHEIALGEFDKNNDGTYSLKFEDIEVGKYTVKETQANIEGYELEYVKMNGSEVSEGTDKAYTTNTVVTKDGKTVTIEDKYKEIIETGDLEIKKTIDGENITEDDLENLKFTVQNEAGEYLYKEDGKVKTSKDKVEIALGEFDKNNDGTYSLKFEDIEVGKYTVKETQANIEGYELEYVKMNGSEVSEGTDKAYTTNTVVTKDGKTVTIEDKYKEIIETGDLEIKKTIDGENITEDDLENLKFTVQNEAGEYLYKDSTGAVKTDKEKHEIALGEFDKNNDGTYSLKFEDIEVGKYTVKETQANIEGYDIEYVEMDGKKFNASNDDSFTTNVVVTKDGKVLEIVDAYKVQTGDLEIKKTLDGDNIVEDDFENLKFTVQNEAGEYLFKDANGNVKTSRDKHEIKLGDFDKNSNGTYTFKFENIEIGEYTVKETQANVEGYELEYVKMNGQKVSEGNDDSYTANTVLTKDGKTVEIEDKYKKVKEDVTEETESTTEETESTVDIETESTKETETTTKETIKETQDVVAEESRESEKKTDKESNKKDKKKDKKDNKKDKKNKDKKEIVRGEERESSSTERITETLTGETEGRSGSSTPQTGDFNHIKELFMLFLSSLVGLVAMVKIKKKNQY